MSEEEKRRNDSHEKEAVTAEQEADESSSPSSHHHHRHHSKAYYSYRRKKHKVKKFFRKYKWLGAVMAVCLLAAIFSAVWIAVSNAQKVDVSNTEEVKPTTAETSRYIPVQLPYFDGPQALVDATVMDYLGSDGSSSLYLRMQGVNDKAAACQPKNIVLSLGLNSLPVSVNVEKATIDVADNANFEKAVTYDVTATRGSAELKYLYTGTTYYYRTEIALSDGTSFTASGQFTTAQSPRLIALDGTVNVRDIGGWYTTDGCRIRQGMLYRGAEIDGAYESALKISTQGVADAHHYLGIVSDFDLRGLTTEVPEDSAFGTTTKHLVFDAYDYESVFTAASQSYLKELFSALAEEDNYPVYLHCSYGLDRTGTACYLLEALLGMSDADLNREFELTCLTYYENNPFEEGGHYTKFLEALKAQPGATSQEKVENYLLTCGVTRQEIEQIKEILLED